MLCLDAGTSDTSLAVWLLQRIRINQSFVPRVLTSQSLKAGCKRQDLLLPSTTNNIQKRFIQTLNESLKD